MEGELIIVSLISTIGMYGAITLYQHNWFKKNTFKAQQLRQRKADDLYFKKLSKQLNVQSKDGISIEKTPSESNISNLAQFIPLLKNLEPEQLKSLVEGLSGEGEEEESSLEGILKLIPPDVIKSFISGLKTGSEENKINEDQFL